MSSEEDFEALQKELTVMLSERCQREADRYADRHCDYNKRSERYDECRGREYERCEDSYEGHTSALLLDRFLDWVDDRFFTRDQLH